jgi:hypothetical protein
MPLGQPARTELKQVDRHQLIMITKPQWQRRSTRERHIHDPTDANSYFVTKSGEYRVNARNAGYRTRIRLLWRHDPNLKT